MILSQPGVFKPKDNCISVGPPLLARVQFHILNDASSNKCACVHIHTGIYSLYIIVI